MKKERVGFWGKLVDVKVLWPDPLCVAADCNVVRFLSECSKGGRLTSS